MFKIDNTPAIEAHRKALEITFAPMIFQAVRVMIKKGVFDYLREIGRTGATYQEVADATGISFYGARVLMQSGLSAGVIYQVSEDRFALTKVGIFLVNDQMPKVNMDFVHDVCYNGMFYLEECIDQGKPVGLKVFGEWPTIYKGLSSLPSDVQESWFNFDHYYSDISFPRAIEYIVENKPVHILDIGGNTGKFCKVALERLPNVRFTIADLPEQIALAKENLGSKGVDLSRVNFQPINILDEAQQLEGKFDIIWMSQFLDCFSDDTIVAILNRCRNHLTDDGHVYVQEEFWDRQWHEAGAVVLQQLSLYFTTMANGCSQMYDFKTFSGLIDKAGYDVEEIKDRDAINVSLLKLKPRA